MEDRELIHVTVQFPVEALQQFSNLIEQLRRLSESAGSRTEQAESSPREQAESAAFDLERFRLLDRAPQDPESVRPPGRELQEPESVRPPRSAAREDAPAVRLPVRREVPAPESAGENVSASAPESEARHPDTVDVGPTEAEAVRLELSDQSEREAPAPQETKEPSAEPPRAAGQEVASREPEAKSVQAEPDTSIPDAPAVRQDPESQIPAAEAAWEEMQERELEAPALRAETGLAAETPLGAGVVVASGADGPPSRQAVISEELVIPGAAPVTAEAVSLAFRRDGRRYDNGFPLY